MLCSKQFSLSFESIFPEVAASWPISGVSAFKGKFGARSVPTNVASLFMNLRLAKEAVQRAAGFVTECGVFGGDELKLSQTSSSDLVAHHLRVVGIDATTASDKRKGGVIVVDGENETGWIAAREAASSGRPAVVLRAASVVANLADGQSEPLGQLDEAMLLRAGAREWSAKSMYEVHALFADGAEVIVATASGKPTWIWVPLGASGVLLLGTDLARDLIRLRQGDRAAVARRPTKPQWGIAGERPIYLFEAGLDPDRPHDRPADWWIWTAREALTAHGFIPADVLPFGAKGMVIVTGDDDQAPLEDYQGQKQRIGLIPVTYFLHPLTKHDRSTMARQEQNACVEWELHPDALETPNEYAKRLEEQCAWFEDLTGKSARLVRNHGYLNDGYWGHARAWLKHSIVGSSNLPGLNGLVLNGSLLPARLELDGELTNHWSQLTAFGDGVFFILGWDADSTIDKLLSYGRTIMESGVPGIIMLNLHPANHVKAAAMHEAAHRLVGELGFAAATFGAALDWFRARDAGVSEPRIQSMIAPFAQTRIRPEAPASSSENVSHEARLKAGLLAFIRRFDFRAGA